MNLISIFSLLFQVSLYKFVRLAGDLLPAPLFVPYIEMLCGLSNSPQAAHHCFNLLKSTANGPLSWDHFFASVKQYYMDLRQDGANTGDTLISDFFSLSLFISTEPTQVFTSPLKDLFLFVLWSNQILVGKKSLLFSWWSPDKVNGYRLVQ